MKTHSISQSHPAVRRSTTATKLAKVILSATVAAFTLAVATGAQPASAQTYSYGPAGHLVDESGYSVETTDEMIARHQLEREQEALEGTTYDSDEGAWVNDYVTGPGFWYNYGLGMNRTTF
jgi:hypothetical protein